MSEAGTKLRNIIQYALITIASDDSGDTQIAQSEATGKPANFNAVYPYGMAANAPKGSSILRFLIGGSSQNMAGIAFNPANRFKNLKPWEVAFGNFLKKSKIFFDEDGNIEIDASEFDGDITLKPGQGTVKIEGDLEVSGTVSASEVEDSTGSLDELRTEYGLHVHGGVTTGPGITGGPEAPPGP